MYCWSHHCEPAHIKLGQVQIGEFGGHTVIQISNPKVCMYVSCAQRVVLLSFDKDTERISFRHYGISAAPSGVTKSVKSLVNRRQLPNMGALGDVSELLTKSGYGSVSYAPQSLPTDR